MGKRSMAIILVLCMAFALFATGCGNADQEPTQSATQELEVKPQSDVVELNYWSMWNEAEPQGAVIKEAAKAFEESHPGVKINISWMGREIVNILATKLEAGEKIDLFDAPVNSVLPIAKQYSLDLTEFYEKTYPTTNGKAYKDVVLPAMIDVTKTYSNEGEINGVSYAPFIQCVFYNKDHFAASGIEKLPQTWDEFMDCCEKLQTAGFAPLTCDDAYMTALPGMYLARAKGAEWVTKLVTENDDEMWKDPAVLQMAEAYAEMAQKGYFEANTASNIFPAGQQSMANGEASMYLNASWLVNELMPVTGEDFPWGQFNFPMVPNGEGNPNSANYGQNDMCINKECKNPDLAFEFAVSLTTGEMDSLYAAATYSVPAGIDSEWPVQLSDAKDVFLSIDQWCPWSGGVDDNADLIATIRTAFIELIGGTLTPENFVQRMVEM